MDKIDTIISQWRRERPDLDSASIGIIGRLARLVTHVERALADNFARFGLKDGEFDVLATLRRAGAPYQLSPTMLYTTLLLTSGAISKRLDRLENAGWVERLPDPNDRRGMLIRLSPAGLELIEQAMSAHIATQEAALSALAEPQREQLAALLSQWLQSFPGEAQAEPKLIPSLAPTERKTS